MDSRAGGPPPVPALVDAAELEDEARAVAAEHEDLKACFEALIEGEHLVDAVRLLAHTLPKREGIFWAWSCARRAGGADPVPAEGAVGTALDAVERWLRQPVEAHRRPMLELAEAAEIGTPAGCAALAVFLSGGSLAPEGLEEVPPEPYAAARAIAGSVILAAAAAEPDEMPEVLRAYLRSGEQVAARVGIWPASPEGKKA